MSPFNHDAQLLRNLAEDVPDMAPRIDGSEQIGLIRCRRCGEHADVSIKYATGTQS